MNTLLEKEVSGPRTSMEEQCILIGRRYYDPEISVWTTVDPANEFWNPYAYHPNPSRYVDPNGESFLTFLQPLFPMTTLVMKIGSAINAAQSSGAEWTWSGVGRLLLSQVSEGAGTLFGDLAGPAIWGIGAVNATFNNWGSDKWGKQVQAFWDNEVATFRNIGASGNFLDFCSNVNQSGLNDFYTGSKDIQYSWSKGADYHGLVSDERGYTAQLWTMGDLFGRDFGAATQGHHIQLHPDYYKNFPDEGGWNSSHTSFTSTKGSVIRHELTHVGQFGRYGLGGMLTRSTYGHHASDYTDAYHQALFSNYGNASWLLT